MSTFRVILLNALVLIIASAWAYLSSDTPSVTALIPAVFGAALWLCGFGIKAGRKLALFGAILLTLVVLIALTTPLRGALAREDTLALVRVGAMMATSALALVALVKDAIAAR